MKSNAKFKENISQENYPEKDLTEILNKKVQMYKALKLIGEAIIGIVSIILLIRIMTSLDFRVKTNPLVILTYVVPAIYGIIAAYKGIKKYKNTLKSTEIVEKYTLKQYRKLKWKFFLSIPFYLIGLSLLILVASILLPILGAPGDISSIQFSEDKYKVGEIIEATFSDMPSWETEKIDSKRSKVSVKGYSPLYEEDIQIYFNYTVEDINDKEYEFLVELAGFDLLDSNESYTDKVSTSLMWEQLHNACDLKTNNKEIVPIDKQKINYLNDQVNNIDFTESNKTNMNDTVALENINDISDLYSEDGNTIELADTNIQYEDFENYIFNNYPFEVLMLASMNEEGYINDDELGIVMAEYLFEYLDYLYEENSITESDKAMIDLIKVVFKQEYGSDLDALQSKIDAYME